MKKGIVMVLFVLVVIVGFGSYFLVKYDFEKVKEVKSIENNYDADFEYEIEDVAYYDKDIVITGWLAETNSTNQYINRKIVLKDESGNIISIKTEMQEREDLEGKNTVETNYIKCGLIGRVNNDKLIEGEKYQIGFIIVNQDEREKMIFTDKFIEIS
ncbi:hypothetical protein [Clostridium sp. 1001271B_151109_B4]|uniref:hypothetical protein n=1 Tax=Clostridium sp. 1001271B_151109_B4 TaxID=2787148 RepID=UPI0018AC0DCF|nr:hypothetical protein [Clostridium sp. 1001271B_151109_B4]